MYILNFTHPLTPEQVERTARLCGLDPADITVVSVNAQVDPLAPLAEQVCRIADAVGWDGDAWQSRRLLVVPPALSWSAALLIAELHGRMGYFPSCLRLRAVAGIVPPRFEVAEVVDLQAQRDGARARR